MILAAWAAYAINKAWVRLRYADAERMNFETPLTTLVWLTSALCIVLTYAATWLVLSGLGVGLWLRLATIITCGTLAGALIPELVKVFTSTGSQHVRETVKSSRNNFFQMKSLGHTFFNSGDVDELEGTGGGDAQSSRSSLILAALPCRLRR